MAMVGGSWVHVSLPDAPDVIYQQQVQSFSHSSSEAREARGLLADVRTT